MVLTRTTDGKTTNNDKRLKNSEFDHEKLLDIIKEAVNQAIEELRIEVCALKSQVDNLTQINKELITILTSDKIKQTRWNAKNVNNVGLSNIDLQSTFNSVSGDTIIEATQKSPKINDNFHRIRDGVRSQRKQIRRNKVGARTDPSIDRVEGGGIIVYSNRYSPVREVAGNAGAQFRRNAIGRKFMKKTILTTLLIYQAMLPLVVVKPISK